MTIKENEKSIGDLLVINKPKKILLVTGVYPPEVGGEATYARLLKDGLPKVSRDKIRAIILNSSRLPSWLASLKGVWIFFRTLSLARYCGLVYALNLSDGRPAYLAAKLLGKPFWLKVTANDVWPEPDQNKITSIVLFLKRINRAIVPNEEFFRLLVGWGVEDKKITVLPNAYSAPSGLETREALRGKWGVSGRIVVAAGRLIPRKNFYRLIELWPAILEKFPDAKLLIAGEGPEQAKLEWLIKEKQVSESVMLAGPLPSETLNIYLRLADAGLSVGAYEAQSHFLLEAIALGTPVIVSNVGDNVALIKKCPNGVVLESLEAKDLLAGLRRAFTLPAAATDSRPPDGSVVSMVSSLIRLLLKDAP